MSHQSSHFDELSEQDIFRVFRSVQRAQKIALIEQIDQQSRIFNLEAELLRSSQHAAQSHGKTRWPQGSAVANLPTGIAGDLALATTSASNAASRMLGIVESAKKEFQAQSQLALESLTGFHEAIARQLNPATRTAHVHAQYQSLVLTAVRIKLADGSTFAEHFSPWVRHQKSKHPALDWDNANVFDTSEAKAVLHDFQMAIQGNPPYREIGNHLNLFPLNTRLASQVLLAAVMTSLAPETERLVPGPLPTAACRAALEKAVAGTDARTIKNQGIDPDCAAQWVLDTAEAMGIVIPSLNALNHGAEFVPG